MAALKGMTGALAPFSYLVTIDLDNKGVQITYACSKGKCFSQANFSNWLICVIF